jgi:hypothetical protein
MTRDEIIEMAKEAFIKRGFWPNEVMWKCWLDAWILSAQHEREACAEIAFNGCLVPPDGGSPTEAERLMCEDIANAIRARGQE